MFFGNLSNNPSGISEQSLESSRIIYAGAVCALAALPLLLTVALTMIWGA